MPDTENDQNKPKSDDLASRIDNIIGGSLTAPKFERVDKSVTSNTTKDRQQQINEVLRAKLKNLGAAESKARDEVIAHVSMALQDIYELENKPKETISSLDQVLGSDLPVLQNVQTAVIREKKLDTSAIQELISKLVDITGPNRDTTPLFLNIEYSSADFLANHSRSVILMAISMAIELSKMMEQKLTSDDISGDLRKILICNRKIFSKQEMINIGLAGLLLDVQYRLVFPVLKKDTVFNFKDQLKIDKHATDAYHFLNSNFPSLDFEIKRAVYQHHERADGSGYPNGVEARLFTKYTAILSFVDYYLLSTTENPFIKWRHPHVVINDMLQTQRKKFDSDILMAFVRGSGMYPLGSWVVLMSGHMGPVVKSNPTNPREPVVRTVLNSKFERLPAITDVDTSVGAIKIMTPIAFSEVKKRIPDFKLAVLDK